MLSVDVSCLPMTTRGQRGHLKECLKRNNQLIIEGT